MNRSARLALLPVLALAAQSGAVEILPDENYHDMQVYRPTGEVKDVVYLLADQGTQEPAIARLGERLARESTLVVRIDSAKLIGDLQKAKGNCVDLGSDFEGQSQYLQARYHLPTYHPPYFIGIGAGAAITYALLAQAPTSTFAGVLSLDFCPELRIRTPLCRGDDLRTVAHAAAGSTELLPLTRSHTRWVVQPDTTGRQCDARSARTFVSRLPQSALITVRNGDTASPSDPDGSRVSEAIGQLFAHQAAVATPASGEVADLPLIEVLPQGESTDTFALLLSGDGGWTGLDKDVAAALAARGVAVVGWDSLRYFWKARTPEELASDASRVIVHYGERWKKSHVLLLGYSQGANVLPFLVNRLSKETRSKVSLVAMTGLGLEADFEFHFANWAGASAKALAILPEAARLGSPKAICIYGKEDPESSCTQLDQSRVQSIALTGGHHFNGDYGKVAEAILQAATARR